MFLRRRQRYGSPQGHAYVTMRRGDRRALLPDVDERKRLDPRVVRQIVDARGLVGTSCPGRRRACERRREKAPPSRLYSGIVTNEASSSQQVTCMRPIFLPCAPLK